MSRWNLAWLLGVSALTLVGLSLSYSAPDDVGNVRTKRDNINLLIDVMEEVHGKYVRKLDDKQMRHFVENMIDGGLRRLDPHSSFDGEEDFKLFQRDTKGRFGGVGIQIYQDRHGQTIVESPILGTPAYKAGVMAGDVIIKVDGKIIHNKKLSEVAKLISGKAGTSVTLTVRHEGAEDTSDLRMKRAEIRVDTVVGDRPRPTSKSKWDYFVDKKNKVAYVRIVKFGNTTVAELTKVVNKLQLQGMQGLIIDLRDNPGGLLSQAVGVSGMFLPNGKSIVSLKERNGKGKSIVAKTPNGLQEPIVNLPIAILLSPYSASASEIVAAALQDHLRAVVIGERSYGKGSVQTVFPMEGGRTALRLTTASYWRPSNKNIHRFLDDDEDDEWGVKPNKGYEVKLDPKERRAYYKYRRERDIVRQPGVQQKDKKKDPALKDKVLEKALEYMRGTINKKAVKKSAQRSIPAQMFPRQQSVPVSAVARFPMIPQPIIENNGRLRT